MAVCHGEFGPDQPTLADMYWLLEGIFDGQLKIMESHFDQQNETLDELTVELRGTGQRAASLEHDDASSHASSWRQTYNRTPRLASVRRMMEQIK